MSIISNRQKIHFIGIGGIGMSALARMFLGEGKQVSGSDRAPSLVTEGLEKLGAKIFYEQEAENIAADVDLIVYTIAIPADNSELLAARAKGIDCLTYPQALGLISAEKYTIAVAGTHGKTTTTAMIAEMMIAASLSPTVVVGSLLKQKNTESSFPGGTNFIAGDSKYLVVEACEYQRSFLNLSPRIAVITNIDNDHLDYYKDFTDIQSAFAEFISKVPDDGFVVCDKKDLRLELVLGQTKATVVDYKNFLERISSSGLTVPGHHNLLNASAALAVGEILQIAEKTSLEALLGFSGVWRRFEPKGEMETGALVYDDYAHHPTEIEAALAGAREFMSNRQMTGKLFAVFQPHLYSRTKILKEDFATKLALADEIIMAPIYAAREPADQTISSEILAEAIARKNPNVRVLRDFAEIAEALRTDTEEGDLIMTIGAGDIYKVGEDLTRNVKIEV
ncbi:MAG TPA: UDP-N-acetylmuramate--L-alanine ligase [Candidatus Paceibacterota bacterium]|jgi:UDP-N-acetylmuramate--alanine ligase|nr:UDP-N-acetylmuramate--L-alanine ligase [Candidatus Paceibacterota bacterium]HPY13128.1 UDP-N-acetylmuramate--L-alanine ligase [Candidatus Paceibacterota bacterium]HQB27219.1 UDP-N-acetylmuramate--L-alanine ligase [Candidatus Paceibacterota bacterium]